MVCVGGVFDGLVGEEEAGELWRGVTDTPEWRMEWLMRHVNADVIVCLADGTPVMAEYRTLSGGKYPVAYLYPSDEGVNL
jgi:hypothetical protein